MDENAIRIYKANLEALQERHHLTDATFLKLAAMSLAAAGEHGGVETMEAAATELKKRGGWSGVKTGPVRLVLAAMVVRRGLRAGPVDDAVAATLAAFPEYKLGKGGVQAYLAAFLMVLQGAGVPPAPEVLARMAAILGYWKEVHPWLTGRDDYPMAALHAMRGEDLLGLSQRLEMAYEDLHGRGFTRGNQLQLATHLLAVSQLDGPAMAARFAAVSEALASCGERVGTSRYDEVALLSVLESPPEVLANEVLKLRDALRATEGGSWLKRVFAGLSKETDLSLAVSLLLAQAPAEAGRDLADRTAVALAQAAVEAQQAAMVAAMVAAMAATSAATSATSGA
jgi:hypothetical protein